MESLATESDKGAQDVAGEPAAQVESSHGSGTGENTNNPSEGPLAEAQPPMTPATPKKPAIAHTPRLKKKIPWKGKSIMVQLPRDEERGRPGKGVVPLRPDEVTTMLREWEELGYSTRGFTLEGADDPLSLSEDYSQSRELWPDLEDVARDRSSRKFQVTLPDLNKWKDYVNEIAEAKLRALGVSFGDDPAPPSFSPAPSNMGRQAPNQYPLPFSPPLPSPSAASIGAPGFPFSQSPALPSGPSPFNPPLPPVPGKYNPRASISGSPHEHPFFSGPQQMILQQQLGRNRSPSMMNLNSFMSPGSPFPPDKMPSPLALHQRHQSLQFPMLPHQNLQRQNSARASPLLQEVREVDEEAPDDTPNEDPSKTPEPGHFVRHNASDSLQREIDEAEYHLEEQFREQLEHEDYSPHNENEKAEARKPVEPTDADMAPHTRGPSVHFANFGADSAQGPVLHHPRPHSRGHSLSQKPFLDNDEGRDGNDESVVKEPHVLNLPPGDGPSEFETNPGNMVTPVAAFNMANKMHQPTFSTVSNPWAEVESFNAGKGPSRRSSHGSKPSLSKLNAGASEFKFNPTSNFTPGQFNFGAGSASSFQPSASNFQPANFQAPTSSHVSVPSTSSSKAKVNAAAPVFSPGNSEFSFGGKSDFNFSAPKYNPDAATFQPFAPFAPSVTSAAASGNESAGNRTNKIFGNIDLSTSGAVKPPRASKAIPIVRPPSHEPPAVEETDQDGRLTDASRRGKEFRKGSGDNDDVPLFAERPMEPEPVPARNPKAVRDPNGNAVRKRGDEDENENENATVGDTTMASTILSESTEGKLQSESNGTKATSSPSETSPDPNKSKWAPFEFSRETEAQDFNNARPPGDDAPFFEKKHKESSSSLSANATSSVPVAPDGFNFGSQQPTETRFEPVLKIQPQPPPILEPEESENDRASSPTPRPEPTSALGPSREPTPHQPTPGGLGLSRFASPPTARGGLAASRFASSQAAAPADQPSRLESFNESIPIPVSPPSETEGQRAEGEHEPTFEEIDEVMQHLNKSDPTMGVNRIVDPLRWHQPSPIRNVNLGAVTASPVHLSPQVAQLRSEAPSPSPHHHRGLPIQSSPGMLAKEVEDPFLDRTHNIRPHEFRGSVHRLNIGEELPESDWDDAFSAGEQDKLEQRVAFFDGHVNEVVDNLLASRLDPLEKTLGSMHHALASLSRRNQPSRHDRSSVSAELQESDADDEDDEVPVPRQSISPRKDKRLEQIRFAVLEAMNQQQSGHGFPMSKPPVDGSVGPDNSSILRALEEMRDQVAHSRLDLDSENIRHIVEAAVVSHMPAMHAPPVVKDDEEATKAMSDMQKKIFELESRLRDEEERSQDKISELEHRLGAKEAKIENELTMRREAEERTIDLRRLLEQAETKVEVEIMNRSSYDQRVHDLEDRLRNAEEMTDQELHGRREAEDKLSEVQRLHRIASEEEERLRNVLEERDEKMRNIEQAADKHRTRLIMLEAAQDDAEKTQVDLTNRLNVTDEELRVTRGEARHWRSEAELARETTRRQTEDFMQSIEESKHLRKLIDTLGTQLEETERIRDGWRKKFSSLQDDMAHTAHEITEENSKRTKREQALIARQEVLDARLQAESRTRERFEAENERLEGGERAAMRAVTECKRLEALLSELRNDNHELQENALRYQRECRETRESAATEIQRARAAMEAEMETLQASVRRYQREHQEARESAATEVQRARTAVEAELEAANNQVNVARAQLEEEVIKVRSELDQVKLDADTAKAHHEMMLEEAQNSKKSELDDLVRKHQNDVEDLQARHERQMLNSTEDAQRSEQHLLERLSLASSKTEHLQDRVSHLEDKLQIAQAAARAAAQAAKSVGHIESEVAAVVVKPAVSQAMQMPEKISPQALRESIMVLQEQLQAREQRIEELEHAVSKLDPEAPSKISKRDDEISWLRELLAVRHGDLQDIIAALSVENFDHETVKDAAIRLHANLQMEEQERERALNGGSAINLPNIAATIRDAATPRVAQAVGPLAAAWGNWKANLSATPSRRHVTPSRVNPNPQNNMLSGLMTPPASGYRSNTPGIDSSRSQPAAFSNAGRRFTPEEFADRPLASSITPRQAEKMPKAGTPPRRVVEPREPVTPPMNGAGGYDADAPSLDDDFDDTGFFDD